MDPETVALYVVFGFGFVCFVGAGWLMGFGHGYYKGWKSALRAIGSPDRRPM